MPDDLGRLLAATQGDDPSTDFVSSLRTELDAELAEGRSGELADEDTSEVIVLDTEDRSDGEARRWRSRTWMLASAAALVVLVALIVGLVASSGDDETSETATEGGAEQQEPAPADQPSPSPEEVALAFMDALNTFDAEAASALIAEDAAFRTDRAGAIESAAEFPALYEWYRVTDSVWNVEACTGSEVDQGTLVVCTYVVENDIIRTVSGSGEISGAYELVIVDGQIVDYWHRWPSAACCWFAFAQYVSDEHPEDMETMYREFQGRKNDQPVLTPESMALWDAHLDEWVSVCEATQDAIYCSAA